MDNLYLTPGLSTDLIGPSTSPMGMALGLNNPYMMNCGYNTNFLGGVAMQAPLTRDMYTGASVKCKTAKNLCWVKNLLLGSALALGGTVILGKFSKLFKQIGKVFKK